MKLNDEMSLFQGNNVNPSTSSMCLSTVVSSVGGKLTRTINLNHIGFFFPLFSLFIYLFIFILCTCMLLEALNQAS